MASRGGRRPGGAAEVKDEVARRRMKHCFPGDEARTKIVSVPQWRRAHDVSGFNAGNGNGSSGNTGRLDGARGSRVWAGRGAAECGAGPVIPCARAARPRTRGVWTSRQPVAGGGHAQRSGMGWRVPSVPGHFWVWMPPEIPVALRRLCPGAAPVHAHPTVPARAPHGSSTAHHPCRAVAPLVDATPGRRLPPVPLPTQRADDRDCCPGRWPRGVRRGEVRAPCRSVGGRAL